MSRITIELTAGVEKGDCAIEAIGSETAPCKEAYADAAGFGNGFWHGLLHDWAGTQSSGLWPYAIGGWDDKEGLDGVRNIVTSANALADPMDGRRRCYLETKPVAARIVSLDTDPRIIQKAVWDNSKGSAPRKYKSKISLEVQNTLESGWSSERSYGISITVGLEVGSEAAGVKSKFEATSSFSETTGKHQSQTHTVNAGAETEVEGDVEPGCIEVAGLVGNQGTLTAEVDLVSTMRGYLLSQYWHKHHHHDWTVDGHGYPNFWFCVEDFAARMGYELCLKRTHTIKYDFYADMVVSSTPVPSLNLEDIQTALFAKAGKDAA